MHLNCSAPLSGNVAAYVVLGSSWCEKQYNLLWCAPLLMGTTSLIFLQSQSLPVVHSVFERLPRCFHLIGWPGLCMSLDYSHTCTAAMKFCVACESTNPWQHLMWTPCCFLLAVKYFLFICLFIIFLSLSTVAWYSLSMGDWFIAIFVRLF